MSEPLRTSIRVSPDFILARHSSPSFGSQHVCSWYLPTARALGLPGQSRIGERHRAGRGTPGRDREAFPPKDTRHANREPKQSQKDQQQIRATASLASPGPAPPCVQATSERRPDWRRCAGRPRGQRRHEGKGLTPRRRLAAPLWNGTTTAALHRQSGIGPGGRHRPKPGHPPFTFIAPLGLASPMTRTHVRLLGPCFKTGRVGHRPFARRERKGVSPSLLHDRRRAARTPEVSPFALVTRRRGTNPSGPSTSPATGRGDLHHGGKYARRRRLGCGHAQECPGRLSESRTRPT